MSWSTTVLRSMLLGLLACHPTPAVESGGQVPQAPEPAPIPDSVGLVDGATVWLMFDPSVVRARHRESLDLSLVMHLFLREVQPASERVLEALADHVPAGTLVYGSVVIDSERELQLVAQGIEERRPAQKVAPRGVGVHLRLAVPDTPRSGLAEAVAEVVHEQWVDPRHPVIDGVCPWFEREGVAGCVAGDGAVLVLSREDETLVIDVVDFMWPAQRVIDEAAHARARQISEREKIDHYAALERAHAELVQREPYSRGDPTDGVRIAGMRRAVASAQSRDPVLAGLQGDAAVYVDADGIANSAWLEELAGRLEWTSSWAWGYSPREDSKEDAGDRRAGAEAKGDAEQADREWRDAKRDEAKRSDAKWGETKEDGGWSDAPRSETRGGDAERDEKRADVKRDKKRADTEHDEKRADTEHDEKRADTKHDEKRADTKREQKRADRKEEVKRSDDEASDEVKAVDHEESEEGPFGRRVEPPFARLRPAEPLLRGMLVRWSWDEDQRDIRWRWIPAPGREEDVAALFASGTASPPLPTMEALCEGTLACLRVPRSFDAEALAALADTEAAARLTSFEQVLQQYPSLATVGLLVVELWPYLMAATLTDFEERGIPVGSADAGLAAAVWADPAQARLPRFSVALRGAEARQGPPALVRQPDSMGKPRPPPRVDLGPDLDAWRLWVVSREVVVARSRPEAPPWLLLASDEDRLAWLASRAREPVDAHGTEILVSDVGSTLSELERFFGSTSARRVDSVWERARLRLFVEAGQPTVDIVISGRRPMAPEVAR